MKILTSCLVALFAWTLDAATIRIKRGVHLARAPQGELLKFVQWVMSPAGQQAVARAGFFPAK